MGFVRRPPSASDGRGDLRRGRNANRPGGCPPGREAPRGGPVRFRAQALGASAGASALGASAGASTLGASAGASTLGSSAGAGVTAGGASAGLSAGAGAAGGGVDGVGGTSSVLQPVRTRHGLQGGFHRDRSLHEGGSGAGRRIRRSRCIVAPGRRRGGDGIATQNPGLILVAPPEGSNDLPTDWAETLFLGSNRVAADRGGDLRIPSAPPPRPVPLKIRPRRPDKHRCGR